MRPNHPGEVGAPGTNRRGVVGEPAFNVDCVRLDMVVALNWRGQFAAAAVHHLDA